MSSFLSEAKNLFAKSYYSNICRDDQQLSIIGKVSKNKPPKSNSFIDKRQESLIKEFERKLNAIKSDIEIVHLWDLVIRDSLTADDYEFSKRPVFSEDIKIEFLKLLREHLMNKKNEIIKLVGFENNYKNKGELGQFEDRLKPLTDEYSICLYLLKYIEPNEEKKEILKFIESVKDEIDTTNIEVTEEQLKGKQTLEKLINEEKQEIKNKNSFTENFQFNLNSAFVSLGLNSLFNLFMMLIK